MNELVRRLCVGTHRICAARATSIEDFKQSIDHGYVLLKFTETRGGTELGIRPDRARSSLDNADFKAGKGVVRIVGTLVLDYNEVELTGDIDLSTLEGTGQLKLLKNEETWRATQEAATATIQ